MNARSTTLAAVSNGGKLAEQKPKDLASLLASPGVQAQIRAALPRHMTAERMARIATTEMRKVPKLQECDPMSFLGAVMQLSQLGLEPGGALGHAWILPFDKRGKVGNEWKVVGTEAQVIIGYRGMIDLARRSGQIVSIEARAVYEGDKFDCVLGLDSKIEHVPDWQNANRSDAAKLRFVYSVAKLKDGGVQFEVMSRAEVDAIRNDSQGFKSAEANAKRYNKAPDSPWHSDYASMALKTVVRRLFKFLPVSIEMQMAVGLDELGDRGMQQNGAVIDGMYREVGEPMQMVEDGTVDARPADEPEADAKPDAGAPLTYPEVREAIERATTVDDLDEAGSLVPSLTVSPAMKQELNDLWLSRKSALTEG